MQTKYANIMLTIIALSLVAQTAISVAKMKTAMPVIIAGVNAGTDKLTVQLDESVSVIVSGIEIDTRLKPLGTQNTLPVSIDGYNGRTLRFASGLPVEINK